MVTNRLLETNISNERIKNETTIQTTNGNIVISSGGFFINCKNADLKNVFKEFFKLVPKHSKIKDIKSIIIEKFSTI